MTDKELEQVAVRFHVRRRTREARPMTLREKIEAAWMACVEWRYAFEGALRGWRCDLSYDAESGDVRGYFHISRSRCGPHGYAPAVSALIASASSLSFFNNWFARSTSSVSTIRMLVASCKHSASDLL